MTAEEMLAEARRGIRRAGVGEVARLVDEGAIVVDLRCPEVRVRTGAIPGSLAIQRSVLEWRADPASPYRDERLARPDARVLLVCEDGYSSSLAADSLRRLGFAAVGDIVGGMAAWLEAGLPVEAVPAIRPPLDGSADDR